MKNSLPFGKFDVNEPLRRKEEGDSFRMLSGPNKKDVNLIITMSWLKQLVAAKYRVVHFNGCCFGWTIKVLPSDFRFSHDIGVCLLIAELVPSQFRFLITMTLKVKLLYCQGEECTDKP